MSSDEADLPLAKAVKTQHFPSPPSRSKDVTTTTPSSRWSCSPSSDLLIPARGHMLSGSYGKATHLSFEVASWETMWAGLTAKAKHGHETVIAAKMVETGMTWEELLRSGPCCSGMTLQISEFWYSLACLFDFGLNVSTMWPSNSKTSSHAIKLGLDARCCRCMAHHNTLNQHLPATFNIEAALQEKARDLIRNKEWSSKISKDVSYSLVLQVLRN
ncbi:hypothetical protein BJ741DRAFT_254195 [Chytriomyces cf. hyalinus JEL632]|nr:hypothetical protein BJ741DRAFT_254195 [Chytriomyces cf. hyalinus JEL632]